MSWHDDPAWMEALEDFQELRAEGVRGVTLDIEKLESFFYDPRTFQLADHVLEAEATEDPDGRRYVPRLIMAYFMLALGAAGVADSPKS